MTKLFLVPPVVVRLVKDELTRKYDLSSLEQITCGAAPLGSDTMASMRKKFKGIVFKQGIPSLLRPISQTSGAFLQSRLPPLLCSILIIL